MKLRRSWLGVLFVGMGMVVVLWTGSASTAATAHQPATSASEAFAAAQTDDVVATVNGEKITRKALTDFLILQYGQPALELLIREKLVEQEAQRLAVSCTEAEIEARLNDEIERLLRRLASEAGVSYPDGLASHLTRIGRSPEDVRGEMKQKLGPHARANVLLEKMAAANVQVTEDEVRQLYDDRYGPKAVVRQIVCAGRAEAEQVRQRLMAGADFATLAREKSMDPISRDRGGEMSPLPNRGVLGKAAFRLKPGQFSDVIRTDDGFHILQLERFLPGQEVKYEEVRETLRAEVLREMAKRRIPELLSQLYHRAEIRRMLAVEAK